MTYNHYFNQPKQMTEWILNRKLYSNPELIKMFQEMPHPLIEKYEKVILGVDENEECI